MHIIIITYDYIYMYIISYIISYTDGVEPFFCSIISPPRDKHHWGTMSYQVRDCCSGMIHCLLDK